MRTTNQKGGAGLIAIVILVVLFSLAAFIFYLVSSKEEVKENDTPVVVEQQADENNTPAEELGPTEILELDPNTTLSTVRDLSKLPSKVPESFVDTLEAELNKNTPNDEGCILEYTINKVSRINVSGSIGSIPSDASAEGCGGGVLVFWYTTYGSEPWKVLETQTVTKCADLIKTTITTEFISECYEGNNVYKLKPNPNGSIRNYKYPS